LPGHPLVQFAGSDQRGHLSDPLSQMGLADSRARSCFTNATPIRKPRNLSVATGREIATKDITFPVIVQTCDRARKPVHVWNLLDLERLRWEGADACGPSRRKTRLRPGLLWRPKLVICRPRVLRVVTPTGRGNHS